MQQRVQPARVFSGKLGILVHSGESGALEGLHV